MTIEKEIRSDFLEGVGAVVCSGLFSTVNNTGIQCAVELGECNRRGRSAKVSDHTGHNRVRGNTDLETLQIFQALHFGLEEEVTEAFFAVAEATERETEFLRLEQEFLCQIAGCEIPEMLLIYESVGDGEQACLVAAVLCKSKRGDTADICDVAVAEQVVQNLVFRTEHSAGLNVDQYAAAGELFHFLFESFCHFTDDCAIKGVDFCIGECYGLICRCGDSAKCKYHAQCHYKCQDFFHWFSFLRFLFFHI